MKPASRGWFAHPVLSMWIALVWLAFQGSLARVHLIAAAVIGLVIPRLAGGFLGPGTRVQRGDRIVRFMLRML